MAEMKLVSNKHWFCSVRSVSLFATGALIVSAAQSVLPDSRRESHGSVQRSTRSGRDIVRTVKAFYASEKPAELIGRPAAIARIEASAVLSTHIILIGPDPERRVLVRTDGPLKRIRTGDWVMVFGTVQRLPKRLNDWGLSAEQARLVPDLPVYISAERVDRNDR